MGRKGEIVQLLVIYFLMFVVAKVFDIVFDAWWVLPLYIMASVALSFVNIPLYRTAESDEVGINVGGCILPLTLSVYLLYGIRSVLESIAIAVIITAIFVIIVAWKSSFYVKGTGVLSPAFLVPLISTLAVCLLTFGENGADNVLFLRLSLGYSLSTMAMIIGTDLCHMKKIGNDGSCGDHMSMGGAGIFDGVWLSGIVTMMMLFPLSYII